ncbi:DUF4139 domain-containing protein [Flavobacterium eburneipallidum]|uniref:DUF4139 domain-containing protein n=1 Tax=Flavobacterium eburneipallidum TaxID=3003263 RepID=UPI00248309EE|nr:DUF4139 domain-containing protein [Flavobacterium eburneipallidum]
MKKNHFLLAFLVSAFAFAQKPIFVAAKVKAATVYFNSAEIAQTTSVMLPKGTSEIVVKNVANYLNENTIQIGTASTVTVLSVQFTDNYISEYELDETNPAIKKVRDSIALVKKEMQRIRNTRESEVKTIELLDKNQQVSGVNSGLNVAELMKMTDYYKTKRTEAKNNCDALDEKSTKLNALLAKLNSKLEINTQKEDKTSNGKLIIQVMNEIAGNVDFDINYLTNSATWKPFYDLRANSVAEPINMMYKAEVIQNTGIDWKKVKLILSSGNPNQNNQAPILSSWSLRYQKNNASFSGYMDQNSVQNQLQGRVAGIAISKNSLAEEVISDDKFKEVIVTGINSAIIENQLNISFDIDIPYDILSNGKAHSVALKEIKIPASFKYYAAPRLEKEAFLLAEITDYSKYNLLKGEANIIFEGLYVGKTQINPSQTSDTLNLSMGRDKKISIKREKVVDKSGTKFLSSKKEQTFTYDITIRNNKKETAQVLLKDQYPLSSDKEIEIELLQSDSAKVNTETGILTWDLDLKPNETKKIRISYRVRYPKDKTIDNL